MTTPAANPQTEALLSMGQALSKLLSSLHGGLIEDASDAYTYTAFNGADLGMNSELVLLFAMAGPSYTKENLPKLGCPFCHRQTAEGVKAVESVEVAKEAPQPKNRRRAKV